METKEKAEIDASIAKHEEAFREAFESIADAAGVEATRPAKLSHPNVIVVDPSVGVLDDGVERPPPFGLPAGLDDAVRRPSLSQALVYAKTKAEPGESMRFSIAVLPGVYVDNRTSLFPVDHGSLELEVIGFGRRAQDVKIVLTENR